MRDGKHLINKRVRHACENPNCPLTGKIIKVKRMPDVTKSGRMHILWVLVKWDEKGNIPPDYQQYIPLKRVKIIAEK